MDWATVVNIAETFGIPVVLLVVFVYLDIMKRRRDDKERAALIEGVGKLEAYQRDKLEGLVVESTAAHREVSNVCEKMIVVTERVSQTQTNLSTVIQNRPCLHHTSGEAGR